MITHFRAGLLGAVALVATASCDSTRVVGTSSVTTRDLLFASARWESQSIARYEYTLQVLCFCFETRPMRVTVRDGAVESVRPEESLTPLPAEQWSWFPSIEGLFRVTAEAIARPASSLRAEFDAVRGFPHEISIDWSSGVADDEVTYLVSDIRVP